VNRNTHGYWTPARQRMHLKSTAERLRNEMAAREMMLQEHHARGEDSTAAFRRLMDEHEGFRRRVKQVEKRLAELGQVGATNPLPGLPAPSLKDVRGV